MKFTKVLINGKSYRLSDRAMELLHIGKHDVQRKDPPLELRKLPPDLTILKIQKKEIIPEVKKEPVIEVKKKEDVVIVESTEVKKPRKKKVNGTVGVKK